MQIFSHSTTPLNKWHGYDPYGNHFRIDDLSVADWIAAAPDGQTRTKEDFYRLRDNTIQANIGKVFNAGDSGRSSILYDTVDSPFSYEIKQVLGAQSQWEKFANFKTNNQGRVIGLDIETFGNVRFGREHSVFGITEIGIIDKVYGSGEDGRYALAIGIDDRQRKYLNDTLVKYRNSSWDMLTHQEQIDLGRASMYAHASTQDITTGAFAGLQQIIGVGNKTTDDKTIEAGITMLAGIKQKTSDVLPRTLEWAQAELQRNDTVFSLANGNFDLDSFVNVLRYGELKGVNKDTRLSLIQTAKNIKSQELDAIYAIRAMAGVEGVSVESFMETHFGERVGASVAEQMKARYISGEHIHSGLSDVEDQLKVLEDVTDDITRTLFDSESHPYTRMEQMRSMLVSQKASDLYLFHHGQLDKTRGLEFAGVVNANGERVGQINYSFTNEFWMVDEANSRYIDVDGEQKYALTFINAAEIANGKEAKDATSFTIVRDSMAEAFDFVERNAKSFNKEQVEPHQIITQQEFKYSDFGRREFEKTQDVASVSSVSVTAADGRKTTEITGGYDSFTKLIDLEKAVGKDLDKIQGTKEKVDFVMDYVSKNYTESTSPISPQSYYEAQAFVGMHKKLKNEMPIFDAIRLNLDVLSVPDEQKTALFKRIYEDTTAYIDSQHGNKKKKNSKTFTMSDVFGVDIEVDGQFHRINAYDTKTAQTGIHSVLNAATSNGGIDRDKIFSVIMDLYDRKLIVDDDYDNLMRIASQVSKSGLYGLSGDIAGSVTRNVYGLFDGATGDNVINYFASHIDKSKNLRFLNQESQEAYGPRKLKKIFQTNGDTIQGIIQSVIDQRATFSVIDANPDSEAFRSQITGLIDYLGLPTKDVTENGSAAKVINEIFYTPDKNGNQAEFNKKYTLDYYEKHGIKSFIVKPDESDSAFILMTKKEDAGRLQQKLLTGELDFSSRNALIESGIYKYGAFEELKKINRYQLDGAELLTVTQGENFEKILTPYLNTMVGNDGVLRAYYNDAEYDFYSQHRKAGGNALDHLVHGEYEAASKSFARTTDSYLQDLSASASYRGVMLDDGTVKRVANFGLGDFIQAREQRIVHGLRTIFEHGVANVPADVQNLSVAQQVVHAFGKSVGIEQYYGEDQAKYYRRVMNSSEFNEFFHKRLYIGTIGEDPNFIPASVGRDAVINGDFNQNFYQIINQMVNGDTGHTLYGAEVQEALNGLASSYKQILNEKKGEKGVVSTVDAADYNSWAILHNAMRPTFGQQNNGMYFERTSMKEALFSGLFDIDGDAFQKSIFFGRVDLTAKELADKRALSAKGYNLLGIKGFDILDYERNFTAQVKQMSNFELQSRYADLRANINGKKYGISDAQYERAVEYFEKQLMSLHEDKIFIASGLNEQELFASRDTKKMTMNWDDVDTVRTENKLKSLIGSEIDSKTVIGVKVDGTPIFYHGPSAVLTKNNVEELLDDSNGNRRMTRVLPTIGDIVDNKIMMNGAEKATVHAIDSRLFAEYIGIQDLEVARRIANQMFGELSGGAVAIANMGGQKHATMMQTHSMWNAMSTMYQEGKYGQAFVNYLNELVATQPVFSGINAFKFEDGRIITDTRLAKNASGAIQYAFDHLLDDSVVTAMANALGKTNDEVRAFSESVVDYVNYMQENNILLTVMQRQTMNEHMGIRVVGDDRIRQAILARGIRPGENGVQDVDVRWSDALDEFAKNYNGAGKYNVSTVLQDFINAYSSGKNEHRIAMAGNKTSLQKSVIGIVESLRYMSNPSKVDIDNSNIVKIGIMDLLEEEGRIKGGLSSHELESSIFFVDGEPSDFLRRHAEASNVNLKQSYSIYLDLGGTQLTSNGTKYDGMLIPVQSVFSDVDDEVFFKNTQGNIVKLVNDTIEAFTTPSLIPRGSDIGAYLSDIYFQQFRTKLENQISLLDKDSDAYKAFNSTIMPVSHQVLAQDEVAPLLDVMFSDKTYKVGNRDYTFRELVDEKTRLEKMLMDSTLTDIDTYAKQYDAIQEVINNTVTSMAENIKNDAGYYAELVGGEANRRLIEAGSFFENGVKHYGLSVAMGVDAFENMGFDLGVIGLDVVNDYLSGRHEFEKIGQFAADNNLDATIVKIAQELEAKTQRQIDPNNIIEEFSNYIADQYGVSTKELNAAIANNQSIFEVLNPFREIGIGYMEQVGTYAELLRYPMFRSQPAVRLILDSTMQGNQLRSSSPILSYLSHVDHDGDTEFIMAISNGMSILKSSDRRFQDIQEIFQRFGKEEYRELLAESVSSMGGLKSEMITNLKVERAKVLEKFKIEEYNKGINAWKTSQGIDLDATLTPSQLLQAQQSSHMEDIFLKNGFNSIEDHEALIAALAARVRKINIGKISTPNYTLRNALLKTYNDSNLTKAQKQLINDTFFDLTNMFSEAGGLFSMTEQKVIDPKHGRDGMTIAKTTRYSTGMARLFSKKRTNETATALREIIEAIGPGVFGTSYDKDIDRLVKIILNNEMSVFKESEKYFHAYRKVDMATGAKELTRITDESTFYALKGLRGLVEIKNQIPGFNYRSSLDKGSFDAEIYDILDSIADGKTDVDVAFRNTAYENFTKALVGTHSTTKTSLDKGRMYFVSGGIGHSLHDNGYVFHKVNKNGQHEFKPVNLQTGEIDHNVVTLSKNTIFDDITPIFARDYKKNASAREDILKQIERNRIAKSLNTMVFDKNGKVRQSTPKEFKLNKKINEYDEYFAKTWVAVDQIFHGHKNYHIDTNAIESQYARLGVALKAYDHAIATQSISGNREILKVGVPDSSGELMRQINQYIANNAEKYGSFDSDGYFSANQPFMQVVNDLISERFVDGRSAFDQFVDVVKNNPNLDILEYNDALDFLNQSSYDIISQEAKYDQLMVDIDLAIQGFKEDGVSEKQLAPLTAVRNRLSKKDFMQEMHAHNQDIMTQAQSRIYKAIGSTQESLSNFFGFNATDIKSMKVGFGQYIGQSFENLSAQDIEHISNSALKIINQGKNNLQTFAAQQTYSNLQKMQAMPGFTPAHTTSALSFKNVYQTLDTISSDANLARKTVKETVKVKNAEDIRKIAENMNTSRANHGGGMEKKTLSGMMLNSVKTFDMSKLPMKQIGIGAAGLMALGLVNKVLHKNDKGSPLSPKRNDNQGDTPGTDNGYGYAPPSATQTIYADNSSGIQYRVSAKSKNYISDTQNARLINMGGGGNSQVYSSSDTSGVTDNWLANKFAELT